MSFIRKNAERPADAGTPAASSGHRYGYGSAYAAAARTRRRARTRNGMVELFTSVLGVGVVFLTGVTVGLAAGMLLAYVQMEETRALEAADRVRAHDIEMRIWEDAAKAGKAGRTGASKEAGEKAGEESEEAFSETPVGKPAAPAKPRRPEVLPYAALTLTPFGIPAADAAERALPAPRSAITADEAVRQAHGVERPNVGGLISNAAQNKDENLGAFGGGDLGLVEKESGYWAGGNGVLFGPASSRVVTCRNESDPECQAVQVMDHGFPERPAVPDDVIIGRDEVVDGAGDEVPGVGGDEGCRSFVIESKPTVETNVCRSGSPFGELTCRAGWEESAVSVMTKWACSKSSPIAESLVCQVPAHFTTTKEHTERCFFDENALAVAYRSTVTTEAEASAVFPATCRATQMTTSDVSCSQILEVAGEPTCTLGEVSKSVTPGPYWLFQDACRQGDTLTIEQTCERALQDRMRTVKLSLNGWPSRTLRGPTSSTWSSNDGKCSATFLIESHVCTGTDCLIKVKVTVKAGLITQGTISALHPYLGWSHNAGLVDSWTDNCAAMEPSESKAGGAR